VNLQDALGAFLLPGRRVIVGAEREVAGENEDRGGEEEESRGVTVLHGRTPGGLKGVGSKIGRIGKGKAAGGEEFSAFEVRSPP